MKSLLFGTAGIPRSTPKPSTINGIKHVKKLGLDSMELEFVRSINVSKELALEVKKTAKEEEITLTCHGQYFVNLNALDKKTLAISKSNIVNGATRAYESGAWSICYHAAYYMKMDKKVVFNNVLKALKEITKELKDNGVDIWLRPETGGKVSQFGELDEMINLSQELDKVLPCIDFAHHHSRSNGKFNTYKEFSQILEEIEKNLGKSALQNMHCHIEGIKYSEKGEQNHLNFDESDFNYLELVKALKNFKVKGVITCESPNIEEDALLLKKAYSKVNTISSKINIRRTDIGP